MDYESPPGTLVVAVHPGQVDTAQPLAGYGNAVVIDHGAGLKTLYAPLGTIEVRPGDCISSNQVIGRLPSGTADSPILHFEVTDDGRFMEPR